MTSPRTKAPKRTLLIGIAQLFNLLQKLIVNKLITLILGPEIFGYISYLNSVIDLSRNFFLFGANQSIIKEISYSHSRLQRKSHLVNLAAKIFLFSSAAGAIFIAAYLIKSGGATPGAVESDNFSIYTLVVALTFFNILGTGFLGIIKGLYVVRWIIATYVISSVVTLLSSPILIFYFNLKGALISLTIPFFVYISAASIIILNNVPKPKTSPDKKYYNHLILRLARQGGGVTLAAILSSSVHFLTIKFISNVASLEIVGYYNAGFILMTGYFSVLTSALTTDFYPRISRLTKSKNEFAKCINDQSQITINFAVPIVIFFSGSMTTVTQILFSSEFLPALEYSEIALFGAVILLFSNQLDLALLSRGRNKEFIIVSIVCRLIELSLNIALYNCFGLKGIAYSYLITAVAHFGLTYIYLKLDFGFALSNEFIVRIVKIFPPLIISYFMLRKVEAIHETYSAIMAMLIAALIFRHMDKRHAQ